MMVVSFEAPASAKQAGVLHYQGYIVVETTNLHKLTNPRPLLVGVYLFIVALGHEIILLG